MKRGGAIQNALVILLPALLIGLAVYVTAATERDTALDGANAEAQSQQLLTGMLDEETGARGFFLTRDPVFLAPWYNGTREFATTIKTARATDAGNRELLRTLNDQARLAAQWHADAQLRISRMLHRSRPPAVAESLGRKSLMDRFRAANTRYRSQLLVQRDASLSSGTLLAVVVAVVVAVSLALAGLILGRRRMRREERRRRRETELRELLQASDNEDESHSLLIGYIEQTVPHAGAAILNRNNSDDRLEISVSGSAGRTPLAALPDTPMAPRACLAVRLSRPQSRGRGEQLLAACEVCGKLGGDVACEPLLVSGKVIGSVLVAGGTMTPEALAQVRGAVDQAAPIIANQRSLSVARLRAASDALTGLPNRRAADETLKRMVAQAGRTLSPLSAILLDLDHFKQINDIHGHEQGDEVLAAVGQVLSSTIRESDFAARFGGEEFLLLLPETTREQAAVAAEKVRHALASAHLSVGSITASLGVAAFPEDGLDSEQLLRRADGALYAAKEHGRDRVELARPRPLPEPVVDRT
ncbi:MAG TPA: diguanylate cyclase [Solirubrobacteraceae bacterium]|nr:diguanylate cyclase [Solirubrobacteraceae bacterium]